MTNTPFPAHEENLPTTPRPTPAAPAPLDYSEATVPRARFGRGPLIAGIVGGVLALGLVFGGGILVGHFALPPAAGVNQSQRGFGGAPGQNGQRPHFNGNQGGMAPGVAPGGDFDPDGGIVPTAAPAR